MIAIEPVQQPELFEPVHEGLHPARLRDTAPETVYAERWKLLNKRDPLQNSGYTYLEHILCPAGRAPGPVSQRDATVAACVIQWLGTNCGMGFLLGTEEEIAKRDSIRALAMRKVFPLVWYRASHNVTSIRPIERGILRD